MTWKLWIDDQLDDPVTPTRHTPIGYFGAKTVQEAKALVERYGMPEFMDLDHDLGTGGETPEFLRWLEEKFPDRLPPEYCIHSRNSVGVRNMISFLESWKRVRA